MAQGEQDESVGWYLPEQRAILPLCEADGLHFSRSNRRLLQNHSFTLTLNHAFREVMEGCRENRDGCWISDKMIDLYDQTHRLGYAHSLECWQDNQLIGGIYGIAIGGLFCGESMFSRVSGASKVALYTLVTTLEKAGYQLFDVQYVNPHLQQFGVKEISADAYGEKLGHALQLTPHKLQIRLT